MQDRPGKTVDDKPDFLLSTHIDIVVYPGADGAAEIMRKPVKNKFSRFNRSGA